MKKLNIFFWQNCISPHQIPYIRQIQMDERVGRVVLIAPRIDYDERKAMGWNADEMLHGSQLEYYVKPSLDKIEELMQYETSHSIHLFSGIRGDYETFQFFLKSRQYQLRRGFIQEPPYTYDKPLWAHYIRFFLQDRKFIKDFDYVFAIGEDAVTYFRSWSKRWKVVPFIYCVEKPQAYSFTKGDDLSICYVGSLSRRKNVLVLLKAMQGIPCHLDIYGDGEERMKLNEFVALHQMEAQVTFHGKVDMKEVTQLMQQHDVLILPSRYDGWGAVVNEALMSGVYSICSNRCGARLLLKNNQLGSVFVNNNVDSLKHQLKTCIQHLEDIRNSVALRRNWSRNICGETVAKYMVDSLLNTHLPQQPWLEK